MRRPGGAVWPQMKPTTGLVTWARMNAAASSSASATAHRAKQALDDRADPNTILVNVGEGTHYARKPLGPGVYFADRHRAAVRKYYQEHPQRSGAVRWQIGEPVPSGATGWKSLSPTTSRSPPASTKW